MGFSNPPVPWAELERRLRGDRGAANRVGSMTAGPGDGPAFSRKRAKFRASEVEQVRSSVPYAELHAHSSYSFLDGASSPEELVTEAVRLGLHGLALTDHDGLHGVVRMAEAAEAHADVGADDSLVTVFGAELSLGLTRPQNGVADPEGDHLLVLARGPEGYHRLSRALTEANLRAGAEKGRPVHDASALAAEADGHWTVLTGCRKGAVRRALAGAPGAEGVAAARVELRRLVEWFGRDRVVVELTDTGLPEDSLRNDQLAELARRDGLAMVATNGVHHATAARHRLAAALAAVRARRSLDELDGWLSPSPGAHLRSGDEMAALFARFPGVVEHSAALADELGFRLRAASPRLPEQEVPAGHTPLSWLRELVARRVGERYPDGGEEVERRLAEEFDVIEQKGFAGYFLIVHDIVSFAHQRGILCQGRGSAAASAICYVLGITVVDPIFYRLPFERFLSMLREEEPDIDVDFDSERREEVIQYVYRRYGRRNAAQVANVVTYRPKNAVRDMAKALGASQGQQDAWAKQVERWGADFATDDHDIPADVIALAEQVLGFPRHLGIHSGGMVLTDRPVSEVCPIEPARMEGRTVLQWDKDDCAWMGLVKFDLLGLGMLTAVQQAFDLVAEHTGEHWTLPTIPRQEPGTFDMLCRADSIGVFQVESRAQIGTLPRLRPRSFYDLTIEIALIRPGPIQGGAVHPYIRRRLGEEPVTYPHPLLKPVLERTLGVPLFQEQLMQMAIAVADFDATDADLLRRAMGSKRGVERIDALREKLYTGMAAHGITGELADEIYVKIEAFANFGFAESHSLSFAVLVYASSWLKLHYPAAFLAALLRAQPMGFYSPSTLVNDARRHGVVVRRPSLERSGVWAGLEPEREGARIGDGIGGGMESCLHDHASAGEFDPDAPDRSAEHRRDGGLVVRLGLADVGSISEEVARRIVDAREDAAFVDVGDLTRRASLDGDQLEALALAGALADLGGVAGRTRREALWLAGEAQGVRAGQLDVPIATQPPLLPEPTAFELLGHDLRATGISPEDHPMRWVRAAMEARGVVSIAGLAAVEPGTRLEVAGVVTHRQRPATAGGMTFLNLEDETGLLNVVATAGLWHRHRRVARTAAAMVVRGVLERSEHGVTNLYADRLEALAMSVTVPSRDFQ